MYNYVYFYDYIFYDYIFYIIFLLLNFKYQNLIYYFNKYIVSNINKPFRKNYKIFIVTNFVFIYFKLTYLIYFIILILI